MNIQFMTEANAFTAKNGEKKYRPNYDEMIKNATCEDEIKAIEECRELFEKLGTGFAFKIVRTVYANRWTANNRFEKGWTIYQHPWYRNENGKDCTESEMLEIIKSEQE